MVTPDFPKSKVIYAYVGRCKCGEIVAATVDEPVLKVDTADAVHGWILDGLTVERMSIEDARNGFGSCKCKPIQKRMDL